MDPKGGQTAFVYTNYIRETPERVWQGLTDPALMKRYWRHQKAGTKTFRSDRKSDGSLHAEVVGAVSMSSDQIVGMDGQEPAVITNAPFGAVTQPVRQARAKDVSYHRHWSADFSGTNSFVTDFRYEG
jgi:hypothetical protein